MYFAYITDATAESNLRIKIGYATDYLDRERQHRESKLGVRVTFTPLCVVGGHKNDERKVHNYFRNFAWPEELELYYPTPEVCDYIRWLRDQYFVWVPEEGQYTPPKHVDAALWLPAPDRRKPAPRAMLHGFNGPLNMPPRELTTDDFYTSPEILTVVRDFFGGAIDLDPASHPIANREVKAQKIFTKHDDGLTKAWHGTVWVNPPFSQWDTWAPKIVSEWKRGSVRDMCVLAATRSITARQFSPIVQTASAVCILLGRKSFWGRWASTPDDGHVIFYFGQRINEFHKAFLELGTVFANCYGIN